MKGIQSSSVVCEHLKEYTSRDSSGVSIYSLSLVGFERKNTTVTVNCDPGIETCSVDRYYAILHSVDTILFIVDTILDTISFYSLY